MEKADLKNPTKIFWPDEGYTKKDLFDYYESMSDYIFPYVKDRPQSLHRFPDGIRGQRFYQKNLEYNPPGYVNTESVYSESNKDYINYIVPKNKETILYMVNLGCIELNPWNSRINSPNKPDYLVIDLDPEEISFEAVIEAAQVTNEFLQELGVQSFVKTSGATGIHIFLPMGAKYAYEQVKDFAHILVLEVNRRLPETTSLERMPAKRKGKVYLDFLQNNLGQTMATAFSVRPKPGATVSMPLFWDEVKSGLSPNDFTILNAKKRAVKIGDPFAGVLKGATDIPKILNRLSS